MTRVHPFRALRYEPKSVELSDVLAPVYDVVAPEDRAGLWDRNEHNAIRLVLTRDAADEAGTDYADVAQRLADWLASGVLRRDDAPRYWVLSQQFEAPDGTRMERLGFFAALALEDYSARVVRPHERTLAGPKKDRRKLLHATKTNLSSVFMLYEDKDDTLAECFETALESPDAVVGTDTSGVLNKLAPVADEGAAAAIREFLAERPVVIADGHHRYETALGYRDELREGGAGDGGHDFILAYFANAFAPGTLLLPIHRLILEGEAPDEAFFAALETAEGGGWERQQTTVADAEAIPAALERHLAPHSGERHAFAADDGSGTLRIFSRPLDAELSVRVIHEEVIGRHFGLSPEAVRDGAVSFPKSALQTARDVRAGRGKVALYLNALRPEDVFRVTEAGETLPQKSTFFMPKLPTGLLFRPFEE